MTDEKIPPEANDEKGHGDSVIPFPKKEEPVSQHPQFSRIEVFPSGADGVQAKICPEVPPMMMIGKDEAMEKTFYVNYLPCVQGRCEMWDDDAQHCGLKLV